MMVVLMLFRVQKRGGHRRYLTTRLLGLLLILDFLSFLDFTYLAILVFVIHIRHTFSLVVLFLFI